jgi:hypothetical protein
VLCESPQILSLQIRHKNTTKQIPAHRLLPHKLLLWQEHAQVT